MKSEHVGQAAPAHSELLPAVQKGREGALLSHVYQQLGLALVSHILEDVLDTSVWEARSSCSSFSLPRCDVLWVPLLQEKCPGWHHQVCSSHQDCGR